jgi:hypothetical protein
MAGIIWGSVPYHTKKLFKEGYVLEILISKVNSPLPIFYLCTLFFFTILLKKSEFSLIHSLVLWCCIICCHIRMLERKSMHFLPPCSWGLSLAQGRVLSSACHTQAQRCSQWCPPCLVEFSEYWIPGEVTILSPIGGWKNRKERRNVYWLKSIMISPQCWMGRGNGFGDSADTVTPVFCKADCDVV